MKTRILLISILLLALIGGCASAAQVLVKNMNSYGDGAYESSSGYVGNVSGTVTAERIQYFQVSQNVSVDSWQVQIATAHTGGANFTNYTAVLFKAYGITDYDTFPDHILNVSYPSDLDTGLYTYTYPTSIELKAGQWYGIHFLEDTDGNYRNHDGLQGGKIGQINIKRDNQAISRYDILWDGSSWSATTDVLNVSFWNNDTQIHVTGTPNLNPTFSTVHTWSIPLAIDKICDSTWTLNGNVIKTDAATSNPSTTISDTDTHFLKNQNNVLSVTSTNATYGSITITIPINQTVGKLENYESPIASEACADVDRNGVTWLLSTGSVYTSSDDLHSITPVTLTSGINAYSTSSVLFYNNTTIFESSATGVQRSIDSGLHFSTVLAGAFRSWNIVKDQSGNVYASTYQNSGVGGNFNNSTIFRSSDYGNTWTTISDFHTRHVHGMGFVGNDLVVTLGDNFDPYPNQSQVGVWRYSGTLWIADLISPYGHQYASVISANGNGILGGDTDAQGMISTYEPGVGYSDSIFNETYRNAIYALRYDSTNDVIYAGLIPDFRVSGATGVLVSGDRGRTWHFLKTTSPPGKLSCISPEGWIYLGSTVPSRIHTVAQSDISVLPLVTDMYAEHTLISKPGDVRIGQPIFNVTKTYGTGNIMLYTTQHITVNTNGNPVTIRPMAGDITVTADKYIGGENVVLNTNGTVNALLRNGTLYTFAPLTAFNIADTGGLYAGSVVQFTDASSGNPPTSWAWNFGDGTTSNEQNPSHTYAVYGAYTVSLTASNAQGSNTNSQIITIENTPTTASQTIQSITIVFGLFGILPIILVIGGILGGFRTKKYDTIIELCIIAVVIFIIIIIGVVILSQFSGV